MSPRVCVHDEYMRSDKRGVWCSKTLAGTCASYVVYYTYCLWGWCDKQRYIRKLCHFQLLLLLLLLMDVRD